MEMAEGRASKESKEELGACGMIILLLLAEEAEENSVGTEPPDVPSWGWPDIVGALESGCL